MTDELERRASDAEREQTVARLREASAVGRLTLEELADRTALAYTARTLEELERVAADLPAVPSGSSRRQPVRWTLVVVGGAARRGRWRVARHSRVLVGIGDCELDLREAELEGDEVDITVVQLIGDTAIVVPRHVDVELSGVVLLGEKEMRGPSEPLPPDAPFVRVRAYVLAGDVTVVRR